MAKALGAARRIGRLWQADNEQQIPQWDLHAVPCVYTACAVARVAEANL